MIHIMQGMSFKTILVCNNVIYIELLFSTSYMCIYIYIYIYLYVIKRERDTDREENTEGAEIMREK